MAAAWQCALFLVFSFYLQLSACWWASLVAQTVTTACNAGDLGSIPESFITEQKFLCTLTPEHAKDFYQKVLQNIGGETLAALRTQEFMSLPHPHLLGEGRGGKGEGRVWADGRGGGHLRGTRRRAGGQKPVWRPKRSSNTPGFHCQGPQPPPSGAWLGTAGGTCCFPAALIPQERLVGVGRRRREQRALTDLTPCCLPWISAGGLCMALWGGLPQWRVPPACCGKGVLSPHCPTLLPAFSRWTFF